MSFDSNSLKYHVVCQHKVGPTASGGLRGLNDFLTSSYTHELSPTHIVTQMLSSM